MRMQIVDDEGVGVLAAAPVLEMRMVGRQFFVPMGDNFRVGGGPCQSRQREAGHCDKSKNDERSGNTSREAKPACQRIGQKPARMRQRKLRGKYCRPVVRMRRTS